MRPSLPIGDEAIRVLAHVQDLTGVHNLRVLLNQTVLPASS